MPKRGARIRSPGKTGAATGAARLRPTPGSEIEEELRATREDHQSVIEQLQAANEELASANEEVQSMNEELRTSKEETQSLNEELQTVNSELQAKVASLERTNDDLQNLIDSTGIAIVFADESLRVKRFTPAARQLVPLITSDIGRPLGDISLVVDYPDLLAHGQEALRTLRPSQREVRTKDGAWYSVEIRPYRTSHNTIDGIAIAFVDITRAKHAEHAARVVRQLEQDIARAVREPLLVLDADLTVVRANHAFCSTFGLDPSEVEGRGIFELGGGDWDIPRLCELLGRLLPENERIEDFEVDHEFRNVGRKVILLNACRLERVGPDAPASILLAFEDATEKRREALPDG